MKRTVRRLSSLFLAFTITAALIVAALAPLFTTATIAQTNPQTTDIFTGQFIPAYFGAAYDPSEAYKQMVGTPVLVFAYDTWGKVVNNFAYETQVKADGSFQAAGLPNASHYGICVPISDTDSSKSFRPPKPDDGIQSAFAYTQQEFPNDAGTVNTQLAKPAKLTSINGESGCRAFLTSHRAVDIANHINIFPLVPTSVLSVIISDKAAGSTDFFNYNKPYEVYAQRVVVNNTDVSGGGFDSPFESPAACQTDSGRQACIDAYNDIFRSGNSMADGPIIRGRTIGYNPTKEDGTANGGGTIFQAFAPRGIYVITYWRPDSRSSNAKMTYLTYDGVSSIGSSYNGIAAEEVRYSSIYPESNAWRALSTRSALAPTDSTRNEAWEAESGTINLWGIVTKGENGKVIPQPAVGLKVNSDKVGFMNTITRVCGATSATGDTGKDHQEGESSIYGIYIVSSACSSKRQSAGEKQGSIKTAIGVLKSQADSDDFREQLGISVNINGKEGPSRRDLSLSVIPDSSIDGFLKRDGRPFAFATVDLLVNGKRHRNVAQADSTGYFYIPNSYFGDNPYAQYQIVASPPHTAPNFSNSHQNSYALDISQVLAAKNGKGGHLGTVAINSKDAGTVQSFLAKLSFSSLMAKLRIPAAFAQTQTKDFDPSQQPIGRGNGGTVWRFEIDQSSIGSHRYLFNMANYSLKTVEINPPVDGVDYAKGNSEYEFFVTGGENGGVYIEADQVPDGTSKDSMLIRGVELTEKEGTDVRFTDMFRDLGTDRLRFNLRVRFEYKGSSPSDGVTQVSNEELEDLEEGVANQDTNSGQVDGTTPPKVLQATWPIEVYALDDPIPSSKDADTSGMSQFHVVYDPIVLEIETPNCGGGSLLKNGAADVLKNLMCKGAMGLINGMKLAINWMGDNFLTVDPLGHGGADTVIKYWNVLRNLVNSLAVLILLIAGVAIMLQYEPTTYNLQSVLKKLIIAIVLVNFSILVIQIAVDIANVVALGGYFMVSRAFETDSSGLTHASAAMGALTASITTMIVAAAASGFSGFMAIIIFVFAILILLIYVAYKIIVQYYFRLVTLWLCVVLAPAAFAARVLPGTSSYFGKWKNILVGTLVAQLALSLMLGLSLAMIVAIKTANSGTEAFLMVIASFVLLYMATKVPNKAAAMAGSDLAGSLETMTRSGITSARKGLSERLQASRLRRAKSSARYQEEGIDAKFTPRTWLSRDGLKQSVKRRASDIGETSVGRVAMTGGVDPRKGAFYRGRFSAAIEEAAGVTPEELVAAQDKGRTEYTKSEEAKMKLDNELAQQSANYGAMLQSKEAIDDEELTGLTGIAKTRRATAGRIRRLGGRFLDPQGRAILTMRTPQEVNAFNKTLDEKFLKAMREKGGVAENVHNYLKEATAAQLQIGITDAAQFEQIFQHAVSRLTPTEIKELGLEKTLRETGSISGPALMKGVAQNLGAEMREIYPEEAANAYVDIFTRKYLNNVDPTWTKSEYIARTAARSERGTNPTAAAGGPRLAPPAATGFTTTPTTPPNGVHIDQVRTDVAEYNRLAALATPTSLEQSQLNTLQRRLQNQYGYS